MGKLIGESLLLSYFSFRTLLLNNMRIHYLLHESFEDVASIDEWANRPGNKITSTRFFEKEFLLPSPEEIDLLIIMGGPMGVYDEDKYHWLKPEKKFIEQVISKGKKVLGICLGSQLLAEVLGGKVYKNKEKEIGWFDIHFTPQAKTDLFFSDYPEDMKVFHWHGDTFDLPAGANHIAYSEACRNQAFTYNDQVVGLQFHIEATRKSIEEFVFHCKDELIEAKYIQKEKELLANVVNIGRMNSYMFALLDKMI